MQEVIIPGRWNEDASNQPTTFESAMKSLLLSVALIAIAPSLALAQSCASPGDLKKLSECELTRLFEEAKPGEIPSGYARGQVLLMTEAKLPKLRARLASSAWKGKHFEADGEFINQWPGFKALRGKAELGVSLHDGKPCLVLEYPPQTPLFGNTRDELREIAPGLYLARLYERCPCPRFRGYFAIQVCCP